ncbi:MAG: ATP-binding cassette domain-containing protein [Bacteroidales bacterium]|nr:ATP-binding cassette domain-containing protein [Bacteroidales bacterium]
MKQYISHLDDDDVLWNKKMSPGEKQRLAFARTLLLRPDYLFMDEATSALDNKMEKELFVRLLEELPNTTIISVAHRLTIDKFHNHILEI